MFKKILLPTDGSAASLQAASTVASFLGASEGVEVTIILSICPMNPVESDYDESFVLRHNETMRRRAEEALAKTARLFAARGVTAVTKVIEGDPVSAAIESEIRSGNYDVVAMGSRGLGMQKTDLHYLGSVTEHVIRRVDIPVLVIPAQASGKGRGDA